MRILFCGDVFGNVGRRILAERLSRLIEEHAVDLCIANGENAAGGKGLTHAISRKLHKYGVQVITGGNHSFANADVFPDMATDPNLLRPHNYPAGNIGKGTALFDLGDGRTVGILNLLGRTFFPDATDCPFRSGAAAIEELTKSTRSIVVDFHAEATSEKKAFFAHVDGRVSAVLGTHTHVQTADEIVSPLGTAYLSDVGMTGPEDSCIGVKKELVVKKYLLQTPVRFEPAEGGPILNAVLLDVDDTTGKASAIRRIYERVHFA